jgi:hypothetical protein
VGAICNAYSQCLRTSWILKKNHLVSHGDGVVWSTLPVQMSNVQKIPPSKLSLLFSRLFLSENLSLVFSSTIIIFSTTYLNSSLFLGFSLQKS